MFLPVTASQGLTWFFEGNATHCEPVGWQRAIRVQSIALSLLVLAQDLFPWTPEEENPIAFYAFLDSPHALRFATLCVGICAVLLTWKKMPPEPLPEQKPEPAEEVWKKGQEVTFESDYWPIGTPAAQKVRRQVTGIYRGGMKKDNQQWVILEISGEHKWFPLPKS